MIDFGWLNIGSLAFGLFALILPMVNLLSDRGQENKKWIVLSFISICACAISLCFQTIYDYHLVEIEDWTALMDTLDIVAFASAGLLIVTILLNAHTLIKYRKKIAK